MVTAVVTIGVGVVLFTFLGGGALARLAYGAGLKEALKAGALASAFALLAVAASLPIYAVIT